MKGHGLGEKNSFKSNVLESERNVMIPSANVDKHSLIGLHISRLESGPLNEVCLSLAHMGGKLARTEFRGDYTVVLFS